uniref:Uncharacterized protein n=1 Tax=Gopherus evgoodei TaxID=1825980 RepID=A0A8C4VBM4_9SAUR
MKPAMETAVEENTEQSQEKKVITRPEMEIGRYHWMYRSSRPHQYHLVPALRGKRLRPRFSKVISDSACVRFWVPNLSH